MLIYLSEESVNSLFKVINETSVSGSYDEKVNRLKRSGVLSDSQDFTCHQTLNKGTPGLSGGNGDGSFNNSIDKEKSEKLANFFPDGSYNYTLIMFPTSVYQNGDVGNGTCQITSQYEVNTRSVVQKLWNQTYKSLVNNILPINTLHTQDIYGINRSINSIGSSTNGTYIMTDETCTILSKGYSAASGEVTNFRLVIIKTGIGFIITSYVLNDVYPENGNSESLRSVVFYTKV
jgi:hypothetical protein